MYLINEPINMYESCVVFCLKVRAFSAQNACKFFNVKVCESQRDIFGKIPQKHLDIEKNFTD